MCNQQNILFNCTRIFPTMLFNSASLKYYIVMKVTCKVSETTDIWIFIYKINIVLCILFYLVGFCYSGVTDEHKLIS
jgi:hypothetical protein